MYNLERIKEKYKEGVNYGIVEMNDGRNYFLVLNRDNIIPSTDIIDIQFHKNGDVVFLDRKSRDDGNVVRINMINTNNTKRSNIQGYNSNIVFVD